MTIQIKKWDKVSRGSRTIEQEHGKIHAGEAHTVSHISSLASDAIAYYGLTTPQSHFSHFRIIRLSPTGSPFTFRIYESTFLDTNSLGTELPNYNMNRNSTHSTSLAFYFAPFVDTNSLGTKIEEEILISAGIQGGALGSPTTFEWMLNDNVNYLLEVKNEDSTAERFSLTTFWYDSNESEDR